MEADSLRTVSCLRGLSDADLAKFDSLLRTREFEPKERIVEEGKPIGGFHIVRQGTVHVRRKAQTREVLLSRIPAGGFFGEINLFDPGMATASIYAVDAVTLSIVGYDSLRAFMEANPEAGYKITSALMGEVCARLRQTNDKLVNSVYWAGQTG